MKNLNRTLADELLSLLRLVHPPIAIAFCDHRPADVDLFQSTYPVATEDGRTGAVPAGCVFWIKAENGVFATVPHDHANCSVGSLTHGLIELEEAATKADVAEICRAGWVDPAMLPHVPVIKTRANHILYGPLGDFPVTPDVVLLRLVAKQAMSLHEAWPELRFEGKPQCHIVAIAREAKQVAISVGCMLSRVRTGLSNNEMTCAIPFERLDAVVAALRRALKADTLVAAYASRDAKRFAGGTAA